MIKNYENMEIFKVENVEVVEENLEFDPASFFGNDTGGMFTAAKETVPEPDKPVKKAKYAGGFGASWKKKEVAPKISISLTTDATKIVRNKP